MTQYYSRVSGEKPNILDIGARKSHYTIGVPAKVTLLDIPQEGELHRSMNLGWNHNTMMQLRARRSNIERLVLQDFLQNNFTDECFDMIAEVFRTLKPGGFFYCTTPNGLSTPNTNPDHVRHYHKQQLEQLLLMHFKEVVVSHAIKRTSFRQIGLRSWRMKNPMRTVASMLANALNGFQSVRHPFEAAHLIGIGYKGV